MKISFFFFNKKYEAYAHMHLNIYVHHRCTNIHLYNKVTWYCPVLISILLYGFSFWVQRVIVMVRYFVFRCHVLSRYISAWLSTDFIVSLSVNCYDILQKDSGMVSSLPLHDFEYSDSLLLDGLPPKAMRLVYTAI